MARIVTTNAVQITHRIGHAGPDQERKGACRDGQVDVGPCDRGHPSRDRRAGAENLASVVKWTTEKFAGYGSDPARYAERSSVKGLIESKTPLMITAAELDPPRFIEQYELAKQATCKGANGCARMFMLPQHSHMSEVYAINTADNRLTDEILDFVKTWK